MSGPEIQVYDNAGIPYGNGIFNITVDRPVMSVIIRRPTANVLTLCEVQAIDGKWCSSFFNEILEENVGTTVKPV